MGLAIGMASATSVGLLLAAVCIDVCGGGILVIFGSKRGSETPAIRERAEAACRLGFLMVAFASGVLTGVLGSASW